MTPVSAAQADSSEDRKRLGQYFTGERLARLLAALAQVNEAKSIIDPMAGIGDMLVGSRQLAAKGALTTVEIDAAAAAALVQRLRPNDGLSMTSLVGDAFSVNTWSNLPQKNWDVVITNPPYVRYQRSRSRGPGRVRVPSAAEVRQGLLMFIEERTLLPRHEREVFRTLAGEYSGLADLAVPSWILCASLVSPFGRLAMVVPDTWLSRNYATPVIYLLRRYFEIEFVVEDGQASWFEDAQVRTTLLVARRVSDRGTALHDEGDAGYLQVRLGRSAANAASLVGALQTGLAPEREFANRLHAIRETRSTECTDAFTAEWTQNRHLRTHLEGQLQIPAWMSEVEPPDIQPIKYSTTHVPRQMRDFLDGSSISLCSLHEYGWRAGQGLRTGANRFFYGEMVSENLAETLLAIDRAFGDKPLTLPSFLLQSVVRKQQDLLPTNGAISSRGRLIYLNSHVLAEHASAIVNHFGLCPYSEIPEPLANYVRLAATVNVGTPEMPRRIPELSAVATNVRLTDPRRPDRYPRLWYQLPPIAPRHTPELFLPRVNHGHSLAVVNTNRMVVDANFSTLWRGGARALSPSALLPLMQSTWTLVAMESLGTVLGGGALKLEATQLRRLPLPALSTEQVSRLEDLDLMREVRGDPRVRAQIDEVIWSSVFTGPALNDFCQRLDRRRIQLLKQRNPRVCNPIQN